jgi:hypothetical protein
MMNMNGFFLNIIKIFRQPDNISIKYVFNDFILKNSLIYIFDDKGCFFFKKIGK